MKNNNKTILIGILLLVALAVAVILVQKRQETRRGAAFANTSLMLLPSDKITGKVNDVISVHLNYATEGGAKLYNAETVVCYGPELELLADQSTGNAELGYGSPIIVTAPPPRPDVCSKVVVLKETSKINLAATAGEMVVLKFKALSVGSGRIYFDKAQSTATGENANSETDKWIEVTQVSDTTYEIFGTTVGDCRWCGQSCVRSTEDLQCADVMPPEGKVCLEENGVCVIKDEANAERFSQGSCDTSTGRYLCTINTYGEFANRGDCEEAEGCNITTTTKYSKGNCNTTTGKYLCTSNANGEFSTLASCEDAEGCNITTTTKYSKGACNTTIGKYSCTAGTTGEYASLSECENASNCEIANSGDSWLKFRMSFMEVTAANKCALAEKMLLKVSVLAADGTIKSYEGIVPTKVGNESGLALYDVKLQLTGFNYRDNIAVFIKGPKHLQGKYGINNQKDYYNKPGGELDGLTSDEATTPVFNFEKYPLLAGDVTGTTADVQDGQIDGLDFSRVKSEAVKQTTVANETYLLTDLNGNCKMEAQDLALLMKSMSVKQGQLY